jgi:hypothetical protein
MRALQEVDWVRSFERRLTPVAVKGRRYVVASGIALVCVAVGLFFFLDFRGNLDRGNFEVLRTVKNSENSIAIVAKRSDHEAMSGDQYFVFVADHIYSPKELRLALHRSHMIFNADRDGLNVYWSSPHDLVINCDSCGINKDDVNEQQFSSGNVSVRYLNFP